MFDADIEELVIINFDPADEFISRPEKSFEIIGDKTLKNANKLLKLLNKDDERKGTLPTKPEKQG